MKPNLFIIGSMKAGTTYLWTLLNAHPSVFMSEPKEPCYFVDPGDLESILPWMWRRGYWKHEQNYLSLFDGAGAAPVVGEASVFYSYQPLAPGVAERLSRFNPDARLIYLMRDPVERAISHYWHNVRYFGEHRPIERAIRDDGQFLQVGDYATQLSEYFKYFPREQILTLTFEDLTEHVEQVMSAVFDWLGLDGSVTLPEVPPQNVTPGQFDGSVWMWRKLRQRNPLMRTAVDRLPAAVRRFGSGLVKREVNPGSADLSGIVDFLRPVQLRQTAALTDLLGREFPQWTTLNPETGPTAAVA